ncbi:MAG: hypothetical protein DWQ10_17130 [Calditrichaeota bacterium]|nr:MAG: hypothetical protein DWQ10_17130 [Calditrichota bacterium]
MSLNLSYNIWFFIGGVLLLTAFSLWVYRSTIPPVNPFYRRVLLVSRILSLLCILFLVFEPQLQFRLEKIQKPVVEVLVDNSASMNLKDDQSTRAQHAREALQILSQNDNLRLNADVTYSVFSDTIGPIDVEEIDSLVFNRDGTNLGLALNESKLSNQEKRVAATILLSDGATNLGDDPITVIENFQSPVYSVIVGQEPKASDIWFNEIITNEIAYAGMKIPVDVYVRSRGFAGQQTGLEIYQGSKSIAKKELTLPADGLEKKVTIYIVPENLGKQKFTARLRPLNDELVPENNQRAFYLNVLKSKLKIYLIAAAPSQDVAFVRQALSRDENFSVEQTVSINATILAGDKLPDEKRLKEIDCIIAMNFVRNRVPRALKSWLENAALKSEKPIMFMTGFVNSAQALWQYKDIIFLAQQPLISSEIFVKAALSENGFLHPIFKTNESTTDLATLIEQLPPVFSTIRKVQFQPNTTVLAYLVGSRTSQIPTNSKNSPMLAVSKSNQKRVVTILGDNLWRWHMLLQRRGEGNSFYSELITNSVRWLAARDESKLLNVQPAGDIFRSGQQINFTAQAYYDDYRARANLQISLQIAGPEKRELVFSEQGDGIYTSSPGILAAGDYTYKARAYDGVTEVSADSGKFSVVPLQWELQKTDVNISLLRKLAHTTDGRVTTIDSLEILMSALQLNAQRTEEIKKIRIWQYWLVLLILLLLLSIEWFMRKQKGML